MPLTAVPSAAKIVFGQPKYRLLAILLFFSFFFVYISIPVFAVPGNSYEFFFASSQPAELAATGLLSLAMAAVFTMQIYAWRSKALAATAAGAGAAGLSSTAFSSLSFSATCASCVSAIFPFLGFGGVLFLLEHRLEFMVITFFIVLASLYLISEGITSTCAACGNMGGRKRNLQAQKADERGMQKQGG